MSLTLLVVYGCEQSETFDDEAITYTVDKVEASFNAETVLDTDNMNKLEAEEIIQAFNDFLKEAHVITNVDTQSNLDGGHWHIALTTVDEQHLSFGVSYEVLPDDQLAVPVYLDEALLGYLKSDDYVSLLEIVESRVDLVD